MIDITDQCGDLTKEADYVAVADFDNPYSTHGEYKDSIAYWNKEVKASFKVFISTRKKLDKALQNHLTSKKK